MLHISPPCFRIVPVTRLVMLFCLVLASSAPGQDKPVHVKAQAPPDLAVLSSGVEGVYFVSKPLKEEYDALLARVTTIEQQLSKGLIEGRPALDELKQLDAELTALRAKIAAQRVLVSPAHISRQKQEVTFPLGPEKLLVITADNIKVVGWDQPHVKCVLEKTVLTSDGTGADEHLEALKLQHKLGVDSELVGRTQAETDAAEEKFLNGPDGRNLTPEQLKSRRQLVKEISDSWSRFARFQGQPLDAVSIEGLTYDQGNRQMTLETKSPNGGGLHQSEWQRHAALTVYVPQCAAIALRGCEAGYDVQGVQADLLLTSAGSHDRDYDAQFVIRDHQGQLIVDNVPLERLERVTGDVTIRLTAEMVNRGTQHSDGQRVWYTPAARKCICREITGSLSAHFLRSDVTLLDIKGPLAVRNDFGNTTWSVTQPLTEKEYSILSESGLVRMELDPKLLGKLRLLAITNCGMVRSNLPQPAFDSASFRTDFLGEGAVDWHGVETAIGRDFELMFLRIKRPTQLFRQEERPPGVDLISRAGLVEVQQK